jgi:hypothetical protein
MIWANPTSARALLRSASLLTALAVSVAGCGGAAEETDEAGNSASASATSDSATEAASPSPSASTESPTGSPTASLSEEPAGADESPAASPTSEPSTTVEADEEEAEAASVQPPPPGSSPREMLLGRRQIPGLNAQHSWRLISTRQGERRKPVWACQVTDFASIGATDVWVRRFAGQPGGAESARARSAVITFVDGISARRAYAVLQAWHDRCEQQLRRDHDRVRVDAAATAVEVEGPGEAEWRLAVYGPVPDDPDATYWDATGYVREGKRISLTTMVSVGQDYNYPRGEEPIVEAVANSAIKLLGR